MRSGRNPIVQLVKRLNELEKLKSLYKQDQIKVLDLSGEIDENQRKTYLCRVYERATPLCLNPCYSSITGALKAQDRHARVKILSVCSEKL